MIKVVSLGYLVGGLFAPSRGTQGKKSALDYPWRGK